MAINLPLEQPVVLPPDPDDSAQQIAAAFAAFQAGQSTTSAYRAAQCHCRALSDLSQRLGGIGGTGVARRCHAAYAFSGRLSPRARPGARRWLARHAATALGGRE